MTVKICPSCLITKTSDQYYRRRTNGLSSYCKDCTKEKSRLHHQHNRAEINARKKDYYTENRDRISARNRNHYRENREAVLEYWRKNRKRTADYKRNRLKTDIEFRLAHNLRSRLSQAVRKDLYTSSAVKNLGCSLVQLKRYLESKFQPGMSWNNYGKWHIDHIIPLSTFDLENREQFLKACHYTNLQPLWARDNLTKGAS